MQIKIVKKRVIKETLNKELFYIMLTVIISERILT
jgi:hypothetical protein